jgi:hypothetical protein
MKEGPLIREENVRRHIRNVSKLWGCQPIFGAALDERTHPCTMTAVSPYKENQIIFFSLLDEDSH